MYKIWDIEDFAGKSLHPREPHNKFANCITPHLAKRVVLTEDGIAFPLKERYDRDAGSLEGIANSSHFKDDQHQGLLPEPKAREHDPLIGVQHALAPFDARAEDNQQPPPEVVEPPAPPVVQPRVWIDTLGRAYPVDHFGNIMRKTNKPFGVPTAMWTKASQKQRQEMREAFKNVPPQARGRRSVGQGQCVRAEENFE